MRFRFDSFVLDSDARQLLRDGAEIALSPKAFQLILVITYGRLQELAPHGLARTAPSRILLRRVREV